MKKKIKLLIINTTNYRLNGITNVILNYYREIDKSRFQIDFVAPNIINENIKLELESNGSKVFKIPMRNKRPFSYMKHLENLIRNNNYDIVHAHGNSYTLALEMYAAKRAQVRVRIAHGHAVSCKNKIVNSILRPLFFSAYTHGFACSEIAGEWLFKGGRYYVINNAFFTDKFKFNKDIRKKYRINLGINNETVIGHVGGFVDTKNHHFLIDIFNEYRSLNPNSKLVLIGGGDRGNIVQYVEALNLKNHVLFLGSRDDVEFILNAFDVLVFPSKNEGLGIVLLEAQANGLPVFASDAISTNVKIIDSFTFVSLKEGAKKWAELIQLAEKNRNVEGYKLVQEKGFGINQESKKLEKIYHKLLSEEI